MVSGCLQILKALLFFLFFPIWTPFIHLYSLIAMARTSKAVLNAYDKSVYCHCPDLRKNAFSYSLLRIMLAVGLSDTTYIILRYVSSMSVLWRVFIINGCWILSKAFLASIEMIIWFIFFSWWTVSHWLIFRCWKIFAFLGKIPTDDGA